MNFTFFLGLTTCLWATPPPVDAIREASEAKRNGIGVVHFVEDVQLEFIPNVNEDEQARDIIASSLEQKRSELLGRFPSSTNQRVDINATFDDRVSRLDTAILIKNLNGNARLSRSTWVDFGNERSRLEQTDLRNVAQIADTYDFSALDRLALDQTKTTISLCDRTIEVLSRSEPPLALIKPLPRFDESYHSLRVGTVPSWAFLGDFDRFTVANGEEVILQGRSRQGTPVIFSITVSPELDLSVTKLMLWIDGAVSQSVELGSYRAVNGRFIPMSASLQRRGSSASGFCTETVLVSEVGTNVSVSDTIFELPQGMAVQDLRPRP